MHFKSTRNMDYLKLASGLLAVVFAVIFIVFRIRQNTQTSMNEEKKVSRTYIPEEEQIEENITEEGILEEEEVHYDTN